MLTFGKSRNKEDLVHFPNELLCCRTTAVQETQRHSSCRAEHLAKDTSEDLGRDLPRHAEKKIMVESEKMLWSQSRKLSCVPELTPLAPVKEEKQIKHR